MYLVGKLIKLLKCYYHKLYGDTAPKDKEYGHSSCIMCDGSRSLIHFWIRIILSSYSTTRRILNVLSILLKENLFDLD